MNLTLSENKYSLSFYLFCAAVVVIYLNSVRIAIDVDGVLFGSGIRMLFISAGPLLLFLTTFIALMEGQGRRLKNFYWVWILGLIFYFFILAINAVLIHQNSFRLITLDTMMLMFLVPGILIGAKKINWIGFDKLIRIIFLLNVLSLLPYVGAYANLTQEIRTSIIMGFNQTPYFFWGATAIWPYLYLTMKDTSWFYKLITVLGIILHFYFALIYLKRAPFVYLLMFLALVFITKKSKFNFKLKLGSISVFLMSIILSVFIFKSVQVEDTAERLQDRFMEGGSLLNTLTQSDRLTYDVKLLANQFSNLEYLMGRGLGGTVRDIKNRYPEENTPTLHNSAVWIALKGGLIFIFIWYFGWLRLIKDFLQKHDNDLNRFYITILPPLMLSWVFGFIYSNIYFLLITMCAGRVMSKEN